MDTCIQNCYYCTDNLGIRLVQLVEVYRGRMAQARVPEADSLPALGKKCPKTGIKKYTAENQCLSDCQYKICPLFSGTAYLEEVPAHC